MDHDLLENSRVVCLGATDFTPGSSEDAPLRITSALGHDTGLVGVQRIHVPAASTDTIDSLDGNFELNLVAPETLPYETYVAVVPSFGPPAPPPPAHRFIGNLYSVRAAGALITTERPMLLRLYYSTETLMGADPHTLAIFAWDAANNQWLNLGGRLLADRQYLSVSTKRFTAYALIATNSWRDEFDDISGLDLESGFDNITVRDLEDDRALVLAQTPGSGTATSIPIQLPPGMLWDSVEFSGVTDPPTSTLRVDVLGEDGVVLLEDVGRGESLGDIDAETNERLRLRVRLGSASETTSPKLGGWWVTWEDWPRVFLPVVQYR